MKFKCPIWLKNNIQLHQHIKELLAILHHTQGMNKSLNDTLAFNIFQATNFKDEILCTMSAIALQYGGELILKQEFIQMIADNKNKLRLSLAIADNKDMLLKVTEVEEDEKK